jgi:adenine-specific DNA-methyltransferase
MKSNHKPKPQKPAHDDPKHRDVEAYTHDSAKRANNPPAGMAQYDKQEDKTKTYAFDPHIDPRLEWAGKAEGTSFDVPTSSIHIHESIKPHKIIRTVQTMGEGYENRQTDLFGDSPAERLRRKQNAIEFYQHGVDWTNRLIAGDSLVVMNSLLEKEGMGGGRCRWRMWTRLMGLSMGATFSRL